MRRARQRVLFIFLAVFGRGFLQADVRSRRLVSARPYQQAGMRSGVLGCLGLVV